MDVESVFQELDQVVAQVAPRLGLACAPGCGACCRRPSRQIEASAAELAPLARHLWNTNQAESVLEAARVAGAEGWCALYQPGPDSPYPQGRCGAYAHRPLTCRLFGASALVDKEGRLRPTLSAVMKRHDPGVASRVEADPSGLPIASQWRFRLGSADPRTLDLRPLNEALVQALEAEGLRRTWDDQTPPPNAA